MEPTIAEVTAKVEKNETLSKAEEKVLMSIPNEEPRAKPKEELFGDDVIIDEKKPDETAKVEEVKKAEEEKQPEKVDDAAKREADEAESRTKVERDIDKPIERVDLKKYTDRERSLFFEMRKERRRAQEAEVERDRLRFQNIQREEKEKAEREKPKEVAPEDDGEFITAKRAKEIAVEAASHARREAIAETNARHSQTVFSMMTNDVMRKYDDAGPVLAQAESILKGDADADAEMRSAVARGENVVEVTYHLVKKSNKFVAPEPVITKVNESRAKRIEENEAKPKTLGAGGGSPPAGDTLSDILQMPLDEYAKLPRSKRQAILRKYGT